MKQRRRSVAVEDGLQGERIEDAVDPDVELVQRGGLEAGRGLSVENSQALGRVAVLAKGYRFAHALTAVAQGVPF